MLNKNLLLKEIRRNAVSLMMWTLVICLLVCVTMGIYPVFLKNQSKILGLMTILPNEVLQFKGISSVNDLMSALGFYSVNNIIYMMVLGSIYATVLGSGILLKEEYNKTAEYLLTRPVTRSEIFLSKLSILLLNVFILNLVTSLAGFITLELAKNSPFSIEAFMILSLYTFLLNLLFGATGLFLSVLVRRARPITTPVIGLVLILYFVFTISKITEGISKIGYLSPFRFADTNVTRAGYAINGWNLLYFLGITILLIGSAFRIYRRKDIYT